MEDLTVTTNYPDFIFLIAEDVPDNLIYLRKLLIQTGATLLSASNGQQALEIVRKNSGIKLIFMDIKMPELDGFDATMLIKKEFPDIPVIATTAYAMQGDRELCLSAGCSGYIAKPIRRSELFRVIKKVLDQSSDFPD